MCRNSLQDIARLAHMAFPTFAAGIYGQNKGSECKHWTRFDLKLLWFGVQALLSHATVLDDRRIAKHLVALSVCPHGIHFFAIRLETIASRLEAIASRSEAIASRLEAIAFRSVFLINLSQRLNRG